jgi:hypothetical protein
MERIRVGVAGVVLTCMALMVATLAFVPGPAGATDSDLKSAAAFKLKASNGYSIFALASSQRADGRGEIVLFVSREQSVATYLAPATVTKARIEADLGALGKIALDVVPSGRQEKVRPPCRTEPRVVDFEPQSYRGSFEFHGEEGYAEAVSSSPREYNRALLGLICGSVGRGETSGQDLHGARLRLHARHGSFRLNLQANKTRPGARSRFEVETHEERQGIAIARQRTVWAGSAAFDFERDLGAATLRPPAPFSGHAVFRRGAASGSRWSGDLTVDLPGRSDVPLTGADVGATLVPSCWHEGEGRFRC